MGCRLRCRKGISGGNCNSAMELCDLLRRNNHVKSDSVKVGRENFRRKFSCEEKNKGNSKTKKQVNRNMAYPLGCVESFTCLTND